KFGVFFKTKEKGNDNLHLSPWNVLGLTDKPLAGAGTEEAAAGVSRPGGGSPVAGMASRGESSPSSTCGWVMSSTGMAGAGAPVAHRERRRRLQRAAVLRWPGGVVEGSGSFTAARRS